MAPVPPASRKLSSRQPRASHKPDRQQPSGNQTPPGAPAQASQAVPQSSVPPCQSLGSSDAVVIPALAAHAQNYLQIHEEKAQKLWLQTDQRWQNKVGKNWVAKKVLGRGGQGIVGWWTYQGPDRANRTMNDIAVKQAVHKSARGFFDGLKSEAHFYSLFAESNSPHIVRMYRRLYKEPGHQTMDFDEGIIHRIFLEFCPGGDLNRWLENKARTAADIDEYELWAIFHCLARAAFVMHHGKEKEEKPEERWMSREIVHFDLKLGNVLVGEGTIDTEHRNTTPFKIADFGMAVKTPAFQDRQYLEKHSYRGTKAWLLPEQVQDKRMIEKVGRRPWLTYNKDHVQNRRYGTASNVWQIGLIMWCLMRNCYESKDWNKMTLYISNLSERLKDSGPTIGLLIDQQEQFGMTTSLYSKRLRATIYECLLVLPDRRIPVGELVDKTWEGLETARMSMGTVGFGLQYPTYVEPRYSDRWYSGQQAPAVQPTSPHSLTSEEKVKLQAEKKAIDAKKEADMKDDLERIQAQLAGRQDSFQLLPLVVPGAVAPSSPSAQDPAQDSVQDPAQGPAQDRAQDPVQVLGPAPGSYRPQPPARSQILDSAAAQVGEEVPAQSQLAALQLTAVIPKRIPNLRAIVEIPATMFRGVRIKNVTLDHLDSEMTVLQIKVMLEQNNCGLRAVEMKLLTGRTTMLNAQKLGEFKNLGTIVRATKI